uniref:Ac52 n=1 Tax=Lymantria dispar multicapsid nuclear polyhedrosis virus TaxID=10449 RepID=A0A0A0YVT7_NPVLD|nr:hypothetical protein [Lymantria dispar multiple nucleopolyhedrovirus]QCQ67304.1 hypothetical protein [Lymantria dispar multiple nucleopolyhedrovirus]QCQ67464.1 hypothetical protein [Lymantria dispar multiple nucleopolyhedrovirus]QIT08099.1 hypothetical protein [Lymantria dispar multiple nucleopolyhedrovirus]
MKPLICSSRLAHSPLVLGGKLNLYFTLRLNGSRRPLADAELSAHRSKQATWNIFSRLRVACSDTIIRPSSPMRSKQMQHSTLTRRHSRLNVRNRYSRLSRPARSVNNMVWWGSRPLIPHSNMELIKPFVKYSRAYRTSANSAAKNKILHEWAKEIDGCRRAETDRRFFCDFCQVLCDETAICACRHCFFPRCTSRLDQELSTYALLSVCYWELQESERRSRDARTVWLERIKFTWITYEDSDKVYIPNAARGDNELVCVQCQRLIDRRACEQFHDAPCQDFNVNLFCSHCLFPLFDICYR